MRKYASVKRLFQDDNKMPEQCSMTFYDVFFDGDRLVVVSR